MGVASIRVYADANGKSKSPQSRSEDAGDVTVVTTDLSAEETVEKYDLEANMFKAIWDWKGGGVLV